MRTEACDSEELYSTEFYVQCQELTQQQFRINLSTDITNENCVDIYLHLISAM